MSATDMFVNDARTALATLAGTGGVAAGPSTCASWRGLASRANDLGLPALAERMRALEASLANRGSLAYEPSQPFADAFLAVHDQVEGLASALAAWAVEAQFTPTRGDA